MIMIVVIIIAKTKVGKIALIYLDESEKTQDKFILSNMGLFKGGSMLHEYMQVIKNILYIPRV